MVHVQNQMDSTLDTTTPGLQNHLSDRLVDVHGRYGKFSQTWRAGTICVHQENPRNLAPRL